MKKLSLVAFAIFVALMPIQTANAQVDFGIRGGLNFSGITGGKLTTESIITYQAGIYLSFSILDSPLSIQLETVYTQKGAKVSGKLIKLTYIQVPFLFRYSFQPREEVNPYLLFGPFVAFNIEDKNNVTDTPIGDNLNATTFGGLVAFGFEINDHFNIELRYSRAAVRYSERNRSGFNSVISIVAGIGF